MNASDVIRMQMENTLICRGKTQCCLPKSINPSVPSNGNLVFRGGLTRQPAVLCPSVVEANPLKCCAPGWCCQTALMTMQQPIICPQQPSTPSSLLAVDPTLSQTLMTRQPAILCPETDINDAQLVAGGPIVPRPLITRQPPVICPSVVVDVPLE